MRSPGGRRQVCFLEAWFPSLTALHGGAVVITGVAVDSTLSRVETYSPEPALHTEYIDDVDEERHRVDGRSVSSSAGLAAVASADASDPCEVDRPADPRHSGGVMVASP